MLHRRVEVDVHHVRDVGGGEVRHRDAGGDAGVVHQAVDAAPLARGLVHELLGGVEVAEVDRPRARLGRVLAALGQHLLEAVGAPRHQPDGRAARRQHRAERGADARRRAGDDDVGSLDLHVPAPLRSAVVAHGGCCRCRRGGGGRAHHVFVRRGDLEVLGHEQRERDVPLVGVAAACSCDVRIMVATSTVFQSTSLLPHACAYTWVSGAGVGRSSTAGSRLLAHVERLQALPPREHVRQEHLRRRRRCRRCSPAGCSHRWARRRSPGACPSGRAPAAGSPAPHASPAVRTAPPSGRRWRRAPCATTAAATATVAAPAAADGTTARGERDPSDDASAATSFAIVRRASGQALTTTGVPSGSCFGQHGDGGVVHADAAVRHVLCRAPTRRCCRGCRSRRRPPRTGRACRSGSTVRRRTARTPCWDRAPGAGRAGSTRRWAWAWACRRRAAADRWHRRPPARCRRRRCPCCTVIVCVAELHVDAERVRL